MDPALEAAPALTTSAIQSLVRRAERYETLLDDREVQAGIQMLSAGESMSVGDRVWLLVAIGMTHRNDGSLPLAISELRRAERIASESGNETMTSLVRMRMSGVLGHHGDFDAALDVADSALGGLPESQRPRLLATVALLHARAERHDDALAAFEVALAAAEQAGDTSVQGQVLNNRAGHYVSRGEFAAAELDQRHAMLIAGGSSAADRAAMEQNLGSILVKQGLLRAGLRHLDRAADVESLGGIGTEALAGVAEALLTAGVLERARLTVERGLERATGEGAHPLVPDLLMLRARISIAERSMDSAAKDAEEAEIAYRSQGRRRTAEVPARVAEICHLGQPLLDTVAEDHLAIAEALTARGLLHPDPFEQAQAFGMVRDRNGNSPHDRLFRDHAVARLCVHRGDLNGAQKAMERCLNSLSDLVADIGSAELRHRAVAATVPVAGLGVDVAFAGSDSSAFARWNKRIRQIVHTQRQVEANPVLVEALTSMRNSMGLRDVGASRKRSSLEQDQSELERRIQALAWTSAQAAPSFGTEPQRDRASPHVEHLHFGISNGQLYGTTLHDESTVIKLGNAANLANLLRRLQFAVSINARETDRPDPRLLHAVRSVSRRVDSWLLGPLLAGSPRRAEIVVHPIAAVMPVPWRLLPSLANCRVSVDQSGRSVGSTEPKKRPRSVAVCVGPGISEPNEVDAIAACFENVIVLRGELATVERVREVLTEVDMVHFAAHGHVHENDPLLASLQLFDGHLTGYDIETLPSVPTTVVMASCRAGGNTRHRTATYGLTSALTSHGAHHVIATPLVLSDHRAATVMGDLHRGLATGHNPLVALSSLAYDDPRTQIAAESLTITQ